MSTTDQAVIIWGEVLWDMFPDGAQLGGAPANVAWHLGLAGGWARLVSRGGDDDDGERAIARLGELVDTSPVQSDPQPATRGGQLRIQSRAPRSRLLAAPPRERTPLHP